MATYCITGSAGRIGREIYDLLSARGHSVLGIDRIPSRSTDMVADLRDAEKLKSAFHGADTVFHVGALHAPHVGMVSDEEFRSINVIGTERVIKTAKEAGARSFVFTSTTALYGYASQEKNRASWITEETIPQPRTIYHETKMEAEHIVRDFAARAFSVHVLRMSRCFPEIPQEMAVYRIHRGIDARDVATAHASAAVMNEIEFSLHNISGTHPFKRDDCEELKRDASAVIRRRVPLLASAFDARGWQLPRSIDRVYVASKAMKALNWKPQHGYAEVLGQFERKSPEVLQLTHC